MLTTVITNQAIIQAVISLVETFDGYRNKFEAWITSFENAVQISSHDILWITFSKMIRSPLTSAHWLREGTPNLMWKEFKCKLSKQYSSIPFDSHVTQAFAHLQQGLDELFKMYPHHASGLLSKIYHTSDNRVHNGDPWKTASEISMHLMHAMREPKAMAELNFTPHKHQQSIKSSPKKRSRTML